MGSAQQLLKPELMAGGPQTRLPGFSEPHTQGGLANAESLKWVGGRLKFGSWTNL